MCFARPRSVSVTTGCGYERGSGGSELRDMLRRMSGCSLACFCYASVGAIMDILSSLISRWTMKFWCKYETADTSSAKMR